MLGLLAAHEGEARPTGKQGVERRALSILCRKCCAVPRDSTLFHFYFPALTCEAFPCRRFAAGAIARPTFFAALGLRHRLALARPALDPVFDYDPSLSSAFRSRPCRCVKCR